MSNNQAHPEGYIPTQEPDNDEDHSLQESGSEDENDNVQDTGENNDNNSQGPIHDEFEGSQYRHVQALLLTFKFNDLDLKDETETMEIALNRLGYQVDNYEIPMSHSQRRLNQKLKAFLSGEAEDILKIIYYHGHGDLSIKRRQAMYQLSSHNHPDEEPTEMIGGIIQELRRGLQLRDDQSRQSIFENSQDYQPIAYVNWGEMQQQIIDAKYDTLTILDSCGAGVAAVTGLEDISKQIHPWQRKLRVAREIKMNSEFFATRNELIAASSWGQATEDRMTPALIEALEKTIVGEGDSASAETLVRDLNNCLAAYYFNNLNSGAESVDIPQSMLAVLRRTKRGKIILPFLTQ